MSKNPLIEYFLPQYPGYTEKQLQDYLYSSPQIYKKGLELYHKKFYEGLDFEDFTTRFHTKWGDPFKKKEDSSGPTSPESFVGSGYSWSRGAIRSGSLAGAAPEDDSLEKIRAKRNGDYQTPAQITDEFEVKLYRRTPLESKLYAFRQMPERQETLAKYEAEMAALQNENVLIEKANARLDKDLRYKYGDDYMSFLESAQPKLQQLKEAGDENAYNQLASKYNEIVTDPLLKERSNLQSLYGVNFDKAKSLIKEDRFKFLQELLDIKESAEAYQEKTGGSPVKEILLKATAKIPQAVGTVMDIAENIVGEDKEYTRWDQMEDWFRDLSKDYEMLAPTPSKFSRPLSTNTVKWKGYEVDIKDSEIQAVRKPDGTAIPVMLSDSDKREIMSLPTKQQYNAKSIAYQGGQVLADVLFQIAGTASVGSVASLAGAGRLAGTIGVTVSTAGAMAPSLYEEGLEAFGGDKEKAGKYALLTGSLIGLSSNLFGLESKMAMLGDGFLDDVIRTRGNAVKLAAGKSLTPVELAAMRVTDIIKAGTGEVVEEQLIENLINVTTRNLMGLPQQDIDQGEFNATSGIVFATGAIFGAANLDSKNEIRLSAMTEAMKNPDAFEKAIIQQIEAGTIAIEDGQTPEDFAATQRNKIQRIKEKYDVLSPKANDPLELVEVLERQVVAEINAEKAKATKVPMAEKQAEEELAAINEEVGAVITPQPEKPGSQLPTEPEKPGSQLPTEPEKPTTEPFDVSGMEIGDLEGSVATLYGKQGVLEVEGDQVIFNDGDTETVIGNATMLTGETDLEISPERPVRILTMEDENTVILDGKRYRWVGENVDNNANVVSMTLENEEGKQVTIRDRDLAIKALIERNRFEHTPEKVEQKLAEKAIEFNLSNTEQFDIEAALNEQMTPVVDKFLNEFMDYEEVGAEIPFNQDELAEVSLWAEDAATRLESMEGEYAAKMKEEILTIKKIADEYISKAPVAEVVEPQVDEKGKKEFERKSMKDREKALTPETIKDAIALFFSSGRVSKNSYFRFGDPVKYKDEFRIRTQFVSKNGRHIDDLAAEIAEQFGADEQAVVNEIIDFIETENTSAYLNEMAERQGVYGQALKGEDTSMISSEELDAVLLNTPLDAADLLDGMDDEQIDAVLKFFGEYTSDDGVVDWDRMIDENFVLPRGIPSIIYDLMDFMKVDEEIVENAPEEEIESYVEQAFDIPERVREALHDLSDAQVAAIVDLATNEGLINEKGEVDLDALAEKVDEYPDFLIEKTEKDAIKRAAGKAVAGAITPDATFGEVKSPRVAEIESQLETARAEATRAQRAYDAKRGELDRRITDDSEDLFGERKSDGGLFDVRVDPSKRNEVLAPLKMAADAAAERVKRLTALLDEAMSNPDPNLFNGDTVTNGFLAMKIGPFTFDRAIQFVKKLFKETFTTKGQLNQNVYDLSETRIRHINTIMKRTGNLNRRLKLLLDKQFPRQVPENILEDLNTVLRNPDLVNGARLAYRDGTLIPDDVLTTLRNMRLLIDSLSKELVNAGIVTGDAAITVLDNMDVYIHRSYQVHDDPDWIDKAQSNMSVWTRGVNYIRGLYMQRIQVMEDLILRMEDRINDLDNRIAALQNTARNNPQTIQRTQKAIDFWTDRINKENAKLIPDPNRLAKYQSQLAGAQARMTAAMSPKTVNTAAVAHHQNAQAILRGRIARLRTEITRLTGRMTNDQVLGAEVRAILIEQQSNLSLASVSRKGKLGSKDLGILKARKDLPEDLRAILGEYSDPFMNFTKTVFKQIHLIENAKFLAQVERDGLNNYLFVEPQPGYETRIAATGSRTMSPLNGYYTSAELAEAFNNYNRPINDIIPAYLMPLVQFSAIAKMSKTVLSPVASVRNFLFNPFFMIADGHIPNPVSKHFKMAMHIASGEIDLANKLFKKGNADQLIERMYAIGVLGESVTFGELQRQKEDLYQREQGPFETEYDKQRSFIERGLHLAQQLYRFGDDFWRVYKFLVERDRLAKLNHSMASFDNLSVTQQRLVEDEAAARIMETLPTYSKIPKNIQALRKIPLTGTFVSFPYEVVRTTKNVVMQSISDMAKPGTFRVAGKRYQSVLAAQRLAGLTAISVGLLAVAKAARYMHGWDDEDEDNLRWHLPPWAENSTVLIIGRDGTQYRYVDFSYIIPQSVVLNTVNTIGDSRKSIPDRAATAVKQFLTPYLSLDMATKRVIEAARGENEKGSIYAPDEPFGSKVAKITQYLTGVLEPGFVTSARRLWKSLFDPYLPYGGKLNPKIEIGAIMTGVRISEGDLEISFARKSDELGDRKRANLKLYTGKRKEQVFQMMPEDERKEALEPYKEKAAVAYRALMTEAIAFYKASVKLGCDPEKCKEDLRSAGFNAREVDNIAGGIIENPIYSDEKTRNGRKRVR